eukprot:Anaeramoba_ignava/a108783_2.p1 GENE.a108783_2~~a108783_2.p1  ORF type:complete len:131 (-),score=22.30 a108783_2:23-415(-)
MKSTFQLLFIFLLHEIQIFKFLFIFFLFFFLYTLSIYTLTLFILSLSSFFPLLSYLFFSFSFFSLSFFYFLFSFLFRPVHFFSGEPSFPVGCLFGLSVLPSPLCFSLLFSLFLSFSFLPTFHYSSFLTSL